MRQTAKVAGAVAGALAVWAVLAHVLTKGLPPGIVVLGLVYGSLYALVAVGIVLIYRADRIVNFAQAATGLVAVVVAVELDVNYGLSWYLSLLVAVVGAAVIGALIQGIVIRRFRSSSRMILTVATIGLAQLLSGTAGLLPTLFCNPSSGAASCAGAGHRSFTGPLHASFTVYPVTFTGDDVLALVATAGLVTALSLFLHRTRHGVAIRAAAENADRAALLGVPVPRLNVIVWCIATVLSAVAILLRVPVEGFSGFQGITGGGSDILLRTLAAAVIARMESLPVAAAAALGIGVYESLATWTFSNTVLVDATLVLVVGAALLLQKKRLGRAAETDGSAWRSVGAVRPIPAALTAFPEVRWSRRVLVTAVAAGAVVLPLLIPGSDTYLLAAILIYCIVGLSLLVLTGWTGQISLGQFGLAGIGGATTATLFVQHGWNFVPAAGAAMLIGAAAALVIGLPALRMSGPFLAVTTLAFGISVSSYLLAPQYLPWFVTPQVPRPTVMGHDWLGSDRGIYFLCLGSFVVVLLAVRALRHSRIGRSLIAVRDNEAAAGAVAINVTRMKLAAFCVSGAMAGFAGALFVVHQRGVNQGAFGADINVAIFSMVVIGGLGSLPGVVLGAAYIWGTQYFLPSGWAYIASGAGILVLLMFLPEGLGGLLYLLRDRLLALVMRRRGITVAAGVLQSSGDDADGDRPPVDTDAVPDDPARVLSGRGGVTT